MKRLLQLLLLLLLCEMLTACERQASVPADYLPWQASQTAEGYTDVFHLQIGKTTLKELIEQRHDFPELGIFMQADKSLQLEAYFGKQRLGMFEARLIAELAAEKPVLERFANERIDEKPQQSGAWRFGVSEANTKQANDFPVKYLVYIPVADYEPDIVTARFGEPAEIVSVKTDAAYWFYPDKGLIILMNAKGGDILYYSARQDYAALKQRLLAESESVAVEKINE